MPFGLLAQQNIARAAIISIATGASLLSPATHVADYTGIGGASVARVRALLQKYPLLMGELSPDAARKVGWDNAAQRFGMT